MNRIEQFNQMLDASKHKYVVIPITENVGHIKPDGNGSGWGTGISNQLILCLQIKCR